MFYLEPAHPHYICEWDLGIEMEAKGKTLFQIEHVYKQYVIGGERCNE